jgi:protein tyrosine/serine phosphatase
MLLYFTRVLLIVAGLTVPVLLAGWQTVAQRNFRVVEPGVFYRSGQMSLDGLRRAVHDYGIRTVISLRETGESAPKDIQREEHWCRHQAGLFFYALPIYGWQAGAGQSEPPAMENVRKLLEILADKRHHPVLIHCYAGVHRTGIYCAVCRMKRQGWDLERTIHEMRVCGYDEFDEHADVQGFLRDLQSR